jgi:hypothetical protein
LAPSTDADAAAAAAADAAADNGGRTNVGRRTTDFDKRLDACGTHIADGSLLRELCPLSCGQRPSVGVCAQVRRTPSWPSLLY